MKRQVLIATSIIIALFVDDGLVVGKDKEQMFQTLRKLNQEFDITYNRNKNNCLSYLGMQIKCNRREITVSQLKYTEEIIKKFNFESANPVYTPMEKE